MGSLTLQTHRRCLRYLNEICGRKALIPRSLKIEVDYDRMECPLHHGSFADVWKGQYGDREVAVRVMGVYSTSDWGEIRRVG